MERRNRLKFLQTGKKSVKSLAGIKHLGVGDVPGDRRETWRQVPDLIHQHRKLLTCEKQDGRN